MFRFATTPIAPLLGQYLPVRAQARLLNRSYLRMQRDAGRSKQVLTTSSGDLFQADLRGFYEWHRWVYGSIDDQLPRLFSCLVRPGERCLDIGVGIGMHTVRLAKLTGAEGEVIAVEPDPELARQATRNIVLNGLANARVIPAIRIDEACLGPIALIKIAADGSETAVLDGAATTIERYHPSIVFEHVPEPLADRTKCPFGHLADAGYLVYRITSRRNRVTGRNSLWLDPIYARPECGRLLAVSEGNASRIISLVASRDGRI